MAQEFEKTEKMLIGSGSKGIEIDERKDEGMDDIEGTLAKMENENANMRRVIQKSMLKKKNTKKPINQIILDSLGKALKEKKYRVLELP